MRWRAREVQHNETRIERRFLFFPHTLDGETRWLEIASVKQRAEVYHLPPLGGGGYSPGRLGPRCVRWIDMAWVDDQRKPVFSPPRSNWARSIRCSLGIHAWEPLKQPGDGYAARDVCVRCGSRFELKFPQHPPEERAVKHANDIEAAVARLSDAVTFADLSDEAQRYNLRHLDGQLDMLKRLVASKMEGRQ